MREFIRKIRLVMNGSPLFVLLIVVFGAVLCVLLALLLFQVDRAYEIAMPVGEDRSAFVDAGIPGSEPQEILVLNSYHRGYSWSDNEMDGIIETFRRSGWKILHRIEYLDCKQFPGMDHFDRMRDLLQEKYRGRKFPVVIAADNPALEFALRYRPRLFPGAAVVFCGINGFTPDMIRGYRNVTGVAERLNALGTMSLAMKLHPWTREVVVVHDYTITGLSTRRETEEQLKPFEGLVTFRYLENMPLSRLKEELQRLTQDTLVLGLSYSIDKEGQVINHEQIANLMSTNSPVPVYAVHEERLGYGIIGGELLSGRSHGAHAGEIALQVLSGVPASRIPVELNCPARVLFDFRQLVRYFIPLSRLPRDSVVVNRPVSFITRYPGLVFTSVGIMIILAVGVLVLGFNVYHRKAAEEEQKKLQAQLLQSQKMEAVGLLAGGLAHDFNNIMTAITGYAALVRKRMTQEDPSRMFVDQVMSAADRASKLTRGLLVFSRKQVIEARPVDLNEIVKNTEKLVMPLIGADIAFTTKLAQGPLTVMADSGQIEQVLMNLCTNARDAMPGGGRLIVETGEITVDDAYRKNHLLERSGHYGLISLSDTGAGMDEKVRKQIFEPFFTTKDAGKGTGLGLSIAYGIIKQHKGMITVSSVPGRGTTFKIFLPLVKSEQGIAAKRAADRIPGGRETILLAEDEPGVRSMIAITLRDAGYTVIEAIDGADALSRFMAHREVVHLLLTDVIMPNKSGTQVYEEIRLANPLIKVLFISGYSATIMQNRGVAAENLSFLPKPVSNDDLLKKVRATLDA